MEALVLTDPHAFEIREAPRPGRSIALHSVRRT